MTKEKFTWAHQFLTLKPGDIVCDDSVLKIVYKIHHPKIYFFEINKSECLDYYHIAVDDYKIYPTTVYRF